MTDTQDDQTQDEETVTVESLADHTYDDKPRPRGTTYQVPVSIVDSLRRNGFALPVDEAKQRNDERKRDEQAPGERDKPRLRTDKREPER